MRKHTLTATLGLLLTFALAPAAKPETAPITEEEAHAIGVDAHLYFYPLVTMDLIGVGANVPEDAISIPSISVMRPANHSTAPTSIRSTSTKARYRLRRLSGRSRFYNPQGFPVANPLNRFAVSSWMPFKYNPDGSLDLYFQNENPGTEKQANWLPAPSAPFNLTMRLCAPKSDALIGKWNPPPVVKVQEQPGLAVQ